MIYYYLQSHGPQFEQAAWLIRLLDCDAVHIGWYHDGTREEFDRFEVQTRYAALDRHANRITYCGMSQVTALLSAIDHALSSDTGWNWFINLSAVCAPLRPVEDLLAFLETNRKQGIENYCLCFPVRKTFSAKLLPPEETVTYVEVPVKRPIVKCDREIAHYFSSDALIPLRNPAVRLCLYSSEVLEDKTILVRRLSRRELDSRTEFFGRHPHYCGRAWYVLSRSLCQRLLDDWSVQGSFYNAFSTVYEPDESALNTWIRATQDVCRATLTNNNLRFNQGSPTVLRDDEVDAVLSSDAFFARKVDLRARGLRQAIERRVRSKGPALT